MNWSISAGGPFRFGRLDLKFHPSSRILAVALSFVVGGCASLPASGPTVREIEAGPADPVAAGYLIVNIDDHVVDVVAHAPGDSFTGSFQNRRPAADLRIGAGDILQISIWEAGGSGLFGPAGAGAGVSGGGPGGGAGLGAQPQLGSHGAALQPVVVGREGFVSIPYAGRIQAAGSTPDQVRARIENALRDKAIQPQVMVALASNGANVATVGGEVARAGIVPLSLRGDRLLDVVAAAGGARFPAHETTVRVTRHGHGVTVSLQRIVNASSENIYVQPGDEIYVSRLPQTFTAFGATGKVGQYAFDTDQLSLAEGVAKAGGLVDNQADPSGVFLFRHEYAKVADQLDNHNASAGRSRVPVIYRLNLREANGYFRAQKFPMRNKDIILVSEADGTQLLKFFTLVSGAAGIVGNLRTAATSGKL